MELTLNLIWIAVVTAGFIFVPKRSRLVWIALIATAALLFPIISVTDDMNADRTFNDAAALIVAMIVLLVAFKAIAHLLSFPEHVYAVQVATPSDPRSPPAR